MPDAATALLLHRCVGGQRLPSCHHIHFTHDTHCREGWVYIPVRYTLYICGVYHREVCDTLI